MKGSLNFDGGCTPNPGLGISASIIYLNNKKIKVSKILSFVTNSNVAEYYGLIIGLEKSLDLGIRELKIYGDSMLVINQVQGRSKTNNAELIQYRNIVLDLLKGFIKWDFNWIERSRNKDVDNLIREIRKGY